ncbi:MAG: hypothetical protein IPM71_08250 [Bacteroidota bacterium]|nr:MAG: hypothetical protein IPM71_08250 [Bacteroidota bacterium]
MKKWFSILFVFFYLSVTSIDAINFHFCHGKLVNVSLNIPTKSCCSDLATVHCACCANVLVDIEVDENQLTAGAATEVICKFSVASQLSDAFLFQPELAASDKTKFPDLSPPLSVHPPFYLVYHSFLFYHS